MTVQHQLEVYIENPVNKLCQLSKKGVHVIVSNLLCCYMYSGTCVLESLQVQCIWPGRYHVTAMSTELVVIRAHMLDLL